MLAIMKKLTKPHSFTRTTMDKWDNLPDMSVYVIAYMGAVLYVGKAVRSTAIRIREHLYPRSPSDIGNWLRLVPDWKNVRLDVLEAPLDETANSWLIRAEAALTNRFQPIFNRRIG